MSTFGKLTADTLDLGLPMSDSPFRLAILSDFTGRANRSTELDADELADRKLTRLTREGFDEFLAKWKPRLHLDLDGGAVELIFARLDDFEPDAVVGRVERFADCYDDDEKAKLLGDILRHRDWQQMESAWRGLDGLLRRVGKDKGIQLFPIDLSAAELTADVLGSEDLSTCGLYRLLVEKGIFGPKGEPWAAVVLDHVFPVADESIELLGRLARIAGQLAAPVLAGAEVAALGLKDPPAEWERLRKLPEAALLCLTVPRMLLRIPYGSDTRPVDAFAFEEFTPGQAGGHLWGNSAWGVAACLALNFAKKGWAMKAGEMLDLTGIALHTYTFDDEVQAVSLERWVDKPAAERATRLGLTPLLAVRGRDQASFARIIAVGEPEKGDPTSYLVGRWNQKGSLRIPQTGKVLPPKPAAAPAAKPTVGSPDAPPTPQVFFLPGTAAPAAPELETWDESTPASAGKSANAHAAPADDGMDPELAALLASMDSGGAETPAIAPADDGMDPELAALLASMDSGGTEAPATETPATDDGMDPELAALLASMDSGGAETPAIAPADDGMDPELAALLKQMEDG
jgi:hypothetical protein